jgi:type I restriction enzyme S subunit
MSWRQGRLGDFLRLKRGHDLPQRARVPGEVPIVSSSGITGFHNEAKVSGPGVVTGRYGTLGEVFYVKEDFWPLNTSLYVEKFFGNDPRFSAYFLKTLGFGARGTAGAVPGVNRNVLHELEVYFPDLEKQNKIVDILSPYDDLIENNRRRIQLLEETARLLYREWFVHLRFPGHEHVNVVNGVPEGWERKTLGEITELHYGKALKQQDRVEGLAPVYGSSGEVGTHERGLVQGPGIVVGRKGTIGSVYWVDSNFWPIDTVYYVEPKDVSFTLFYALLHTPFVSSDAAVPGLNRKFAYSRPVLWPNSSLRAQFEEYVADISAQISNLKRQNKRLAEARDLLLPRLMNGEIAV